MATASVRLSGDFVHETTSIHHGGTEFTVKTEKIKGFTSDFFFPVLDGFLRELRASVVNAF